MDRTVLTPITLTTSHPLFADVASQLAGPLLRLVEVGAGLVTATTTPDSEHGTHEVVSWRPASESDGATVASMYTRQNADDLDEVVATLTGTLKAELDARTELAARALITHPLFSRIPADQLPGNLLQVIEVGAGLVTVVATPDSEWGSHEVTGWYPAGQVEIDLEVKEFGEAGPGARFASARTLLDASEIDRSVTATVAFLGERIEGLTEVSA